MANWAGFSDDDLRRMKRQMSGNEEVKPASNAKQNPTKKVMTNTNRPRPREKLSNGRMAKTSNQDTPTNPDAMLSKPTPKEQSPTPSSKTFNADDSSNRKRKMEVKSSTVQKDVVMVSGDNSIEPNVDHNMPDNQESLTEEIDVKEGMSRELNKIEVFQQQQKAIEELNRKKRQMLTNAIAERQKKAKKEASTLTELTRELGKLDQLLHSDVSVLRDKIEEASREFTEAQKRYERAEQEFVDAKIHLHKTSDLKDDLVEHLYSIIHQNEVRKSKKLAELMDKLHLADSEELGLELLNNIPDMALLNDLHSTTENSKTLTTSNLDKKIKQRTASDSGSQQEAVIKQPSSDQNQKDVPKSSDKIDENSKTKPGDEQKQKEAPVEKTVELNTENKTESVIMKDPATKKMDADIKVDENVPPINQEDESGTMKSAENAQIDKNEIDSEVAKSIENTKEEKTDT
ncbi:unnamed protein product [Owenia fusiformis]|uniref:RAB6-interacting golgin n=1 Tax=Owenia fusiformis TaxID=6347 RepID=A0A8J1Y3L0_OWEFU|nr:unnamed protein product [Owenia fusiformis]